MNKSKYISIAIFLFAYVSGICAGATFTVGPDAGEFDYTSIQAAIDDADNGSQIEVSPGTYHEAINFLGKAVRLYSSGGPEVTNIDGTGHYHVVQCFSGEGTDTILEGFTITGGNARDAVWPYNCGGGMHNRGSSPSVIHCIFIGNTAKYGGGMYNHQSSPTVIDSTFVANSAADSGGAMGNHQSNPIIARCVFTGNTGGQHGGGIYNDVSSPTITDCMFSGNYAPFGGGMSNLGSRATVVNCTFIDNRGLWGGGMNNRGGGSIDGASPMVINSTFTGNSASNSGGAIGNAFGGKPTIINSILWGNTAPADPEIYIASDSSPTFTYCAVQGDSLWPGDGNINADPLFVDASAGDLRLSFGSPCIDAGSNAAVPAGITTDPDGNDRILDGTLDGTPTVDMGAYEFDVTVFPFNVTQGQFYPTIQAAIDDADADDEIVVSPGTYHEAINFLGKAVRLYSSDGPEVTIIDGSQPTVLLQEDFDDGNYNGWTIIDQGTNSAPSNWVVEGEQMVQKSNIHGIPLSDPKMLGTFALWNDAAAMAWTDLAMTVTMRSTDDDAMGVMFRYQDEHNYYRFAWLNQNHNQGVGRRQLSRMQNGELTVLAQNDVPYTVSQSYAVKIVTSGANLQVLVNGLSVLTATDTTFTDGSVALFCWGNQNTYFDNIEVVLPIYHVVQCVSGEGPDTILEGFTLAGGNADGPADTDKRGGGMCNLQSSPTVTNCIFRHNTATDGGGMYNSASRPTITHSSFLNNSAKVTGGGMYNRDQSHLTITHSTFIGNYAVGGGGAMVNTIYTHPKMTNCVFIGNTTPSRGGAIYNYFHSNPTITNCTFSRNTADDAGGGIYNDQNCTPTVANSILWGNSPDSFLNVNSTPNVTYSNIQGDSLWPGDGNINAAPLFVDAANGNLRLGQGSPCIDAGNNDAVPTGITTDLNGWSRFIDAPCTTDTGSGTGAVVDMGAYEFMPDFHPYLVWLTQHGLEEGPATAPCASVLHDGIPNLLKFAANVSPLQRLPAEFLPTMTIVEVEGLKFLGLTVRLHPGIGDVIWAVQESSDLKQWIATSQEYAAPTDHPDGTRSWHLRSLSQLLDGPVFLRLSLELVE